MASGDAARLPEGLPNLLKTHNFNLYPTSCPANNMVLQDVKGRTVDLNALKGKVVILNFWKIDCQPCTVEKPILERLHRRYADRGLEIVAVNLFDEHGRVESYVRRGGFGFRFCSDPQGRFSVRKQSFGGGMPTTFVVNEKSEAIYEVPGVPTSYLIDRKGQVIGNAVGMVNWEERPFVDLLESLLGPPRRMVAQSTSSFSDAAGQGPVANPTERQFGPRRLEESSSSSEAHELSDVASSRVTSGSLPLQGAADSESSLESPSVTREAVSGNPSRKRTLESPPNSVRKKPSRKRKPRRMTEKANPAVKYGKPKPFQPSGTKSRTSASGQSSLQKLAQARPTRPVPTPYVPPGTTPGTTNLSPMQQARPALPAAMPYTPPNIPRGDVVTRPPVVPDESGHVMARMPAKYSVSGERAVDPLDRPVPGTPVSQPRLPSNPIDGFILDSFDRGAAPRSAKPQALYPQHTQQTTSTQAPDATPASSVLGQLGRDVRNFGQGIKQTFSGWWPTGGR